MNEIRDALAGLDPASSHEIGRSPQPTIYTPPGHQAALDPDRLLVVGARGAGKTFWSDVLIQPESRASVLNAYPRLAERPYEALLGFSASESEDHPSALVLDRLEADGFELELIWRVVVLDRALAALGRPRLYTWQQRVAWAVEDVERFHGALREANDSLAAADRQLLIVFDALDRLGGNWQVINARTRALLKTLLAIRSYHSFKAKVFMRADQATDPAPFQFPDASRILNARVELKWNRRDLYGLAFARLLQDRNAGPGFAALTAKIVGKIPSSGLPTELKEDESVQEALFSRLAGPYMGRDPRRGRTYPWLHNHLADARLAVSPRTFLIALRAAAEHLPAPLDTALDQHGLRAGISVAAGARVAELEEDVPWLRVAFEPLADLRVPCSVDDFVERWQQAGTVAAIDRFVHESGRPGPPPLPGGTVAEEREMEIVGAMVHLGVMEVRDDIRVNIPDIYRVPAKMLRKGGVPPSQA